MKALVHPLIWGALIGVIALALGLAAASPLLAWRDPIYIISGFAGIFALALLLLQPLLAGGYVSKLTRARARRLHRIFGAALLGFILLHVAGLWITSPPDMIDAMLLRSPSPFSLWGVIAMWALFLAGVLALLRRRIPARAWRRAHTGAVLLAAIGSVLHALQIEGTMETFSKAMLCALVLGASFKTVIDLRIWAREPKT